MTNDAVTPNPSPEDVLTGALRNFHAANVRETWAKALARRVDDPANAITLARTLLESICKHILDGSGTRYSHGQPLPELYKLTAGALDIAPTMNTEPVFTTLFNACAEVVKGVGQLRNFLSDSHGHGKAAPVPDWRHAELAINLAGSMATYLLAIWENRQPTVATLIEAYLVAPPKKLGESHESLLRMLLRKPISGKIGAWLTIDDLVEHTRSRIADGVAPATVNQDVSFLRGVFKHAKVSDDVFRLARPILTAEGLIGKSKERLRRPKPAELERILGHFRELEKGVVNPKYSKRRKIMMSVVTDFAAASGRKISEITKLKWADLDRSKQTCRVNGREFRLYGRAWEIALAQPQNDARIFPYNSKSCSAVFTAAKDGLGFKDLVLNDLRLEAQCRLFEAGYGIHEVSYATGQQDHNILARIKRLLIDQPRNVQ